MSGPGIHTMAAADYHQDPCEQPSLSASIAHVLVTESPKHAWTQHPRLNPDYAPNNDQKFDVGKVAHALFLEGVDVVELIDADNYRTAAAQEARDAARAAGRVPLLAREVEQVKVMLDATRPQLDAVDAVPPLFTEGNPEQTLIWDDDGVWCRARADWLRTDYATIDDFKSTSRTANPAQWTRSMFGMGCDMQAAFYLRGLQAITGVVAEFRFVVQETFPPYALSVVGLGPDVVTLANKKVEYALNLWRRCLATDTWPAYPAQVCWAELPTYEEARWLEKELIEEAA